MVETYIMITVVLKAMMKKQVVRKNIMVENSTTIELVRRSILLERTS